MDGFNVQPPLLGYETFDNQLATKKLGNVGMVNYNLDRDEGFLDVAEVFVYHGRAILLDEREVGGDFTEGLGKLMGTFREGTVLLVVKGTNMSFRDVAIQESRLIKETVAVGDNLRQRDIDVRWTAVKQELLL